LRERVSSSQAIINKTGSDFKRSAIDFRQARALLHSTSTHV